MSTETVFDPLRRKEVAATPEETVRQWFISWLRDTAGVPAHLMMSEAGFKYGNKRYRADILVYGRDAGPLAVVECKRPDVPLSAAVAAQAMRYDMVLGVHWIFLTNGVETLVFRRDGSSFVPCKQIPDYQQMLCQL